MTLNRKDEIVHSAPGRHTTLRAAVQALSLRNVDLAVCELLNEALSKLVLLAYEQDAGGLCNLDAITGRFLIPLPFGRNGYAQWGLRPQEANILRQILFGWQKEASPLLYYDPMRRSWFINLDDYANIHLAKQWLTRHQIGVASYRTARAKRVGNG